MKNKDFITELFNITDYLNEFLSGQLVNNTITINQYKAMHKKLCELEGVGLDIHYFNEDVENAEKEKGENG